MFKVCEIIGISKIKFFSFSGTERVKKNQKKYIYIKKKNQTLLTLLVNHFSSSSNKNQIFLGFFTKILTFPLPVPHWVGDNTDLSSNSNISKTVRVKIAFTITF